MSIYKKFTKDFGIVGITNIVLALKGIILLPIITKTLGAEGYGIWAQVGITLGLTSPIAGLILSYSFVRFFAAVKDKKEIQNGFFSILITQLCWSSVIALVLFFLATPIANTLFGDTNAVDIVKITAIIIPFSTINALMISYFRAYLQMKTFSALTIIQSFGELAAIMYFLLQGYGIFGAVISLLIVIVIMDLIMLAMIISQIGIGIPKFANMRSYLKFSTPLIPTEFANWAVKSSDRYVIALFMGLAPVGIYSAAYGLANAISMLTNPFGLLLVPNISKLYDEGKIEDVKRFLAYSFKYILMLIIPAAFGVSILAKPILQIMTTPEFVSSGCLIVPFVASSLVLLCIYAILVQVIALVKKNEIVGTIWTIAALTNLGLNVIFVPRIGILGAAITTLIAYVMITAATAYFSVKYLSFTIYWQAILKSIAAAIVMCMVIWYLNPTQLFDVLLCIGAGAVTYAAILLLSKAFTEEEIRFFRDLFST